MKRKHRIASGCAAALVTCWSAAPTTAEAFVEVVVPATADFTLSTNLSVAIDNVRLIYGFNASGFQTPNFFTIESIGIGPQSQTVTLVDPMNGEGTFPDQLTWGLIGTYGTDGVSLLAPSSFPNPVPDPNTWEGYFGSFLLESDVRDAVVEGDEAALVEFFDFDFNEGLVSMDAQDLAIFNFSDITLNGSLELTPVPEPSAYSFLLGMVAFSCIFARRRSHRA